MGILLTHGLRSVQVLKMAEREQYQELMRMLKMW